MTILEVMIVLAIIGGGAVLVRSGFRRLTKADLVEDATELTAVLRRTSQLAVEYGELHRVMIDMEKHLYAVEACKGPIALVRNEAVQRDPEEIKRALERGTQKLSELPPDALAADDPDVAVRRASAVAGHHIADRECAPVEYSRHATGDTEGKKWVRGLRAGKGIKFKEIWVQHRDDSATSGQIAIYFFPMGSAEKAVIEMTDGDDTFSILVHGLTGRVELRDSALSNIDDHMLRNAMGDKDAEREETETE